MKIRWKGCQRPIARQLAFEINVLGDDVVGVAVLACLSARMRAAQQRQVGRGSSLASGRLRKSLLGNNTTPRTSPNFDPSSRIIFFCDRVSIDIQSPIFRRGPARRVMVANTTAANTTSQPFCVGVQASCCSTSVATQRLSSEHFSFRVSTFDGVHTSDDVSCHAIHFNSRPHG